MKGWVVLAAAGALIGCTAVVRAADLSIREPGGPAVVFAEPELCTTPAYRPLGFRYFAGAVTYVPGFSVGHRRYCRTVAVNGPNGPRYIRRCF